MYICILDLDSMSMSQYLHCMHMHMVMSSSQRDYDNVCARAADHDGYTRIHIRDREHRQWPRYAIDCATSTTSLAGVCNARAACSCWRANLRLGDRPAPCCTSAENSKNCNRVGHSVRSRGRNRKKKKTPSGITACTPRVVMPPS
jgi:hypothetical protein